MAAIIVPQRLKINNQVVCRDLGCYLPVLPIACAFSLAILSAYMGAVQRQNMAFHEYLFEDKVRKIREKRLDLISNIFGVCTVACVMLLIINKCWPNFFISLTGKLNAVLCNLWSKTLKKSDNHEPKKDEASVNSNDIKFNEVSSEKEENERPLTERTERRKIKTPRPKRHSLESSRTCPDTSRDDISWMQTARPPQDFEAETNKKHGVPRKSVEGHPVSKFEHANFARGDTNEICDKTCNSVSSLTEVSEQQLPGAFDDSGVGMMTHSFSGTVTPPVEKLSSRLSLTRSQSQNVSNTSPEYHAVSLKRSSLNSFEDRNATPKEDQEVSDDMFELERQQESEFWELTRQRLERRWLLR